RGPNDADTPSCRQGLRLVTEAGLADSRITGNEDKSTSPGNDLVEALGDLAQFRRPTDELAGRWHPWSLAQPRRTGPGVRAAAGCRKDSRPCAPCVRSAPMR